MITKTTHHYYSPVMFHGRSGLARILHWGAHKLSAEGSRIDSPKAPKVGDWRCPLPKRLWGLGERCERPQRQRPRRQRIFGIFEAHRTLLVERTVLL